jgi:hypothetical protein
MLIDVVRKAMRVTSTMTDDEIEIYIEAAKADMRRLGIRAELIADEKTMHPMVKHAIMCYCASSYGLENPDATRYHNDYVWIVTSLVNSSLNETLYEEPVEEPTSEPAEEPDGETPDGNSQDEGGDTP